MRTATSAYLLLLFILALAGCAGGDDGQTRSERESTSRDSSSSSDEGAAEPASNSAEKPSEEATADGDSDDESEGESGRGAAVASPDGFSAVSDSAGKADVGGDPASGLAAPTPDVAEPTPPVEPPSRDIQSGTLTAGVWDDNLNFETFTAYRDSLGQTQGLLPLTAEEVAAAHTKFAAPRGAKAKLDVALVVDTTGSMGDEIHYLQTELVAISQAVATKYPAAEQRWSLIVYRDQGDEYLTRVFDFDSSVAVIGSKLQAQSAGGGGDFPEAPDAALAAMNQLAWRADASVAKLAFWVADAPPHADKTTAMAGAVRVSAGQDIHLYPVASSGVDEVTEHIMRSTAQLTGGRYLFLTDDSGVGGSHKEPTIPCYIVTRLDVAILRMVDSEMTGTQVAPLASDIIRTKGDPQQGICTLASGAQVTLF